MKRLLKWLAILAAIFIFFIFIAYLFIDALLDTEPYVSQDSFLEISLSGSLPEYEAPDALREYLSGSVLDMKKIRQSFKMATVDDRIKGVVLRIGFMMTGFAKIEEIHQMIEGFQTSGKRVFAHLDYGLTRDYYLASACDSVFISPGGNLFLTGLLAEITFYKGLLKKIGVEADFEHVGKYKNAPDVYTRQSMSESQREVIDAIFDARYKSMIQSIAENRGIKYRDVFNLIENISGFTPEEALKNRLVDGIKYPAQIYEIFETNEKKISKISAGEYSSIDPGSVGLEGKDRIAVIYCLGTMTGGEDGSDPYFGRTMGANRVIRDISQAADASSIKAIILRINSPGGSSLAADKIWYALNDAAKQKPIIASISDVGASGGYYIAIPADTIIAQKRSIVGSIGVFAGKFSLKKLYEKIELKNEVIKRGKNAGLFSLNSKFSDSERIIIRNMINDFYHNFVSKVSRARNQSYDQIDRIARGRVWDGARSKNLKLIDLLGGFDDAVIAAKSLAGIESSTTVKLIYYPKRRSIFNRYLESVINIKKTFENPVGQLENLLQQYHMQPLTLMPFAFDPK
jgi:protease-4